MVRESLFEINIYFVSLLKVVPFIAFLDRLCGRFAELQTCASAAAHRVQLFDFGFEKLGVSFVLQGLE